MEHGGGLAWVGLGGEKGEIDNINNRISITPRAIGRSQTFQSTGNKEILSLPLSASRPWSHQKVPRYGLGK